MIIMENITTSRLSLDFHQSEEYKQTAYMEKLLFILHYAIIIPFILFLFSRMLRCLRHRGWISQGSERRMREDIESSMTNIATGGELPLIKIAAGPLLASNSTSDANSQ